MTEYGLAELLAEHYEAPFETGRRLKVGTTRVGQLVAEGRLRAVRTPLGHLIERASVDALLRQRQAQPAGRRAAQA